MRALFWKIRYTLYGQRHCPIGWCNWWHFAESEIEVDSHYGFSPEDSAQECINIMATDI